MQATQITKKPKNICTCDHFAPNVREIRSLNFNRNLATNLAQLGLSASGILDWGYLELLEHHAGRVHDLDDQPIDLDTEDANGDTLLDRVFGGDPVRFINRYLERAHKPGRNRLKASQVLPILLLYYAHKVNHCRTEGSCSQCDQ